MALACRHRCGTGRRVSASECLRSGWLKGRVVGQGAGGEGREGGMKRHLWVSWVEVDEGGDGEGRGTVRCLRLRESNREE